eukprot:CAMPEP_0201510450 /NCGR_PEP_ID=MMETSP0161_2-20130828/3134_1 /ASSEMBLY_ACC=CAM_ASM_000251 /TAXON_ID=180227 /ORGANISM="Neoparamoeba aestuarina, Strain SoJaBio B1-5/56/2" /LENGTH=453 /DNA_ID=CAMNT_0047905623 /DNA_START=163 /DNA_END=1524 /DNA_ORIENTATION=-
MNRLKEIMQPLRVAVSESPLSQIEPKPKQVWMQSSSLFDKVNEKDKNELLKLPEEMSREGLLLRRSVGSMMGMVVADALGAPFEFLPVRDWDMTRNKRPSNSQDPFFEYPKDRAGVHHNPFNTFELKPGQWTDDASMGFCMADSLICKGQYDGANMRVWFWNWWSNGLNNAFRYDEQRKKAHAGFGGMSLSVGLGGNISKSLSEVSQFMRQLKDIPPRCTLQNEDAGNGSIMRLAPIPIRYHTDVEKAMAMAYESSFTTHPGPLAAEACAFLSYLIVRCLHRKKGEEGQMSARQFLDVVVGEYMMRLVDKEERAKKVMWRLLRGEEKDSSNERCWNWRKKDLGLAKTLRNRGHRYNGYPVSPGYFGSYSMDGLAMALHAIYHTNSFSEALVYIINMLGDCDSTGSVVGQIAGAFYGIEGFDPAWLEDVRKWEKREGEMRAIMLFADGYLKEGE